MKTGQILSVVLVPILVIIALLKFTAFPLTIILGITSFFQADFAVLYYLIAKLNPGKIKSDDAYRIALKNSVFFLIALTILAYMFKQ
ncbi:MAG: hypothetical protein HY776_07230 [Actinobacteria bacterium]|nr:hypothetical protein [Actinomycetota bacterium]